MQKSNQSYRINITNPKYCVVLSDTEEGTTYGPVKEFGEGQEIQVTPSVATGTLYGNGMVVDSTSKLTGMAVSLRLTKLPIEDVAEIYDATVTNGVIQEKAGATAKYIAVGYEVEQTDGKSEYVWLLKGRPRPMNRTNTQSEGNVTYSTDTVEIDFVARKSDKNIRWYADASCSDFTEAQAKAWFTNGPSAIPS